ncbi:UDP-N-acetylglucosamine--N-acetylmuramyl-(pentapeptide) pyrophosphoryl-undecaprenol N-acetylglucosamine transferase [Algimonas arctica]|uniref:UDP-N-acetylglucosamine--N-acetylmuramyl-(pentapeptide) pyrophosphoryl-undecaprenol N-acetylglucosamine transferase n=1 Tax=Algimonas arctica TaxID=1479486 RepID=A0A8J3CUE2_9PROT|nr:undecaprenyldiphospho-muramoylpentapeptide beta-N-acetylglucosaminyltransferase [Algimonas arctica]GHB01373.1 UDP-N-acetylglucosamine--N-acetylmuramyl-(pentapeptide) pyrophosphoryl-undecaprenol N-acetylglucosamine transferase [Algimonas arctica]
MRALLAAGGTGGHMFPAQSLSEELTRLGWECAMITDARGRKHAGRIKADPIIEVKAASISPRHPIKAVRGTWQLAQGVRQSKAFMRAWKPDVVIGFGGYPSFPALRAAERLGIARVIHEQNAVLGRVNRVFAKKATVVASGFADLAKLPDGSNHQFIGNPMRDAILKASNKSVSGPGINLVIVGGSLGANIISDVVPQAVAALPAEIRKMMTVTQQTTKTHLDAAQKQYADAGVAATLDTFFSDIEVHLAKADLIIARAGASSVSEIALMGKPSILVPLGIAMDDHQTANAKALERLDAAKIVPESDFTVDRLTQVLTEILNDTDWLDRAGRNASKLARPDASRDLAALVVSAAGK